MTRSRSPSPDLERCFRLKYCCCILYVVATRQSRERRRESREREKERELRRHSCLNAPGPLFFALGKLRVLTDSRELRPLVFTRRSLQQPQHVSCAHMNSAQRYKMCEPLFTKSAHRIIKPTFALEFAVLFQQRGGLPFDTSASMVPPKKTQCRPAMGQIA